MIISALVEMHVGAGIGGYRWGQVQVVEVEMQVGAGRSSGGGDAGGCR